MWLFPLLSGLTAKTSSRALGANAVVGIRYDSSSVEPRGAAPEVLCYGTAVVTARRSKRPMPEPALYRKCAKSSAGRSPERHGSAELA